jgi:hypothetical protein
MEMGIKIIGMSSEDTCGCCGKKNLKRTVRVEVNGEEQHWGVICASKARGDRGTATDTKYLMQAAKFVTLAKQILNNGGTMDQVSRLPCSWPCRIKDGKFQAFNMVNQLIAEIAL